MKVEKTLQRITALIVQSCDPEAILLFGSYAKEQENPDSDLDILVIGNFRESPYLRGQEVRELMKRYPIPIDLHFMTPMEVTTESRKPYDFINSVLSSSVTLYKKE
jgi:predicted nucleotidyltransferase